MENNNSLENEIDEMIESIDEVLEHLEELLKEILGFFFYVLTREKNTLYYETIIFLGDGLNEKQ